MGIFEGEDDAPEQSQVSDESVPVPRDPRLDPLRRGVASLWDGEHRLGLLATDVQVWWREKGLLRKTKVDPREVVAVQMLIEGEIPEGSDYAGTELDWIDDYWEADDPDVGALLRGRLERGGWELRVEWLDGVEANRALAENAHFFDIDES